VDVRQELRERGRQAMTTNDDGLRMADGPGKFEGELLISERLYDFVADNGVYEETSAEGWGQYSLVRAGSFGGRWHGMLTHDGFELTEAESDFLADYVGAILYESSDGSVHVTYYETTKELNVAWNDITEWCND
jgi:hypothetical protein